MRIYHFSSVSLVHQNANVFSIRRQTVVADRAPERSAAAPVHVPANVAKVVKFVEKFVKFVNLVNLVKIVSNGSLVKSGRVAHDLLLLNGRVDGSLPYTGMYLLQGSNTSPRCNTRLCKRQDRFPPTS